MWCTSEGGLPLETTATTAVKEIEVQQREDAGDKVFVLSVPWEGT